VTLTALLTTVISTALDHLMSRNVCATLFPTVHVSIPLDVLGCLHENHVHETFPDVSVAWRNLLTISITVASAERSFSKTKFGW